ncbi:hypothetical protein K501DRAFT_276727 [Backusella circina FSU 941]|nr:hypothetical protein K501DRAFT_276727 [Backusella circina FSU 941]
MQKAKESDRNIIYDMGQYYYDNKSYDKALSYYRKAALKLKAASNGNGKAKKALKRLIDQGIDTNGKKRGFEEIEQLKRELTQLKANLQDNPNNDIYYDSPNEESGDENDINYDTEDNISDDDNGDNELTSTSGNLDFNSSEDLTKFIQFIHFD